LKLKNIFNKNSFNSKNTLKRSCFSVSASKVVISTCDEILPSLFVGDKRLSVLEVILDEKETQSW